MNQRDRHYWRRNAWRYPGGGPRPSRIDQQSVAAIAGGIFLAAALIAILKIGGVL